MPEINFSSMFNPFFTIPAGHQKPPDKATYFLAGKVKTTDPHCECD